MVLLLLPFLVILAVSSSSLAWTPSSHVFLKRRRSLPKNMQRSEMFLEQNGKKKSKMLRHDSILNLSQSTTEEEPVMEPKQLKMFNSRTRRKEDFVPQQQKRDQGGKITVTMYTCGPTVYDSAHIGNFRAFLTYDLLKRVLMYLGYEVIHICNITDVDDKIIKKANQQALPIGSIQTLTQFYETAFFQDLQRLSCLPASYYPRATEHVPAMLRFIQDLAVPLDDSTLPLAYETNDGSWYFDTQQLPGGTYGRQLVDLNYEDMERQKETVENAEGKKHFADFCLWKAYKEGYDREDSAWSSAQFTEMARPNLVIQEESPLNLMEQLKRQQPYPDPTLPDIRQGRPGWHLECSAMAQTYFGLSTPIDFHGGGIDLKFPHHENEIAQSTGWKRRWNAATGMPRVNDSNEKKKEEIMFCNCWFHNGFVNMGTEKMSKSLGNFITLQDACPTTLDQRAYRYLVLSSSYRNPLSFTSQIMQASKNAVLRIDRVKAHLDQTASMCMGEVDFGSASTLADSMVPHTLDLFEKAILDDLSMPRAAAALFDLVKAAEVELKISPEDERDVRGLLAIRTAMLEMDRVFGMFDRASEKIDDAEDASTCLADDPAIPSDVMDLVQQRIDAKSAQDYALADEIRKRILYEYGYVIKDVKGGDPIVTPVPVEN
jgi:cysteinyl-tRNA synthetase